MNPELRRMFWLEVSPQRLWLFPAAILATTALLANGGAGTVVMRAVAMLGFVVFTIIWGARQAADAVLDEAREHTWTIQRMSALGAWPMTWGKLLGATFIPWYAGAGCLAVYLAYLPADDAAGAPYALMLVLFAICAQGFALTMALVSVHLERGARARLNILVVLLALSLLLPELSAVINLDLAVFSFTEGTTTWYGQTFPAPTFALGVLASFALWSLLGAYRAMCIELQIRTTPWAWAGFVIFLAAFSCGFARDTLAVDLVRSWCSSAAVIACVASYLTGFAFTRDPVQYRRVLQAWREGRFRRAVEETPLWVSSVFFALVAGLLATVLGTDPALSNEQIGNLGAVALTLGLMTVRDLSLLVACSFWLDARRVEVLVLIYIAILNRLLPTLLLVLGVPGLASLIKPAVFEAPHFAMGVAAVQAALGVLLGMAAYRRVMPALSSSGDQKS